MDHPFALTAAELKARRDKLNQLTYAALFGRTLEDRQQASQDAVHLSGQLDAQLRAAFVSADGIASLGRAPYRSLLNAISDFIQVVEEPVMMQGMPMETACNDTASPARFAGHR